jgi:hypothetical protein
LGRRHGSAHHHHWAAFAQAHIEAARRTDPSPGPARERLKAIILEAAYRFIAVNDAKGLITIPMAQAIMHSLAVNAAKGLQRSQRLLTRL